MLAQGIGVRMHLKYEWKIKSNFVIKRVPKCTDWKRNSKEKLSQHKDELGLKGDSIRMNIFENVVPPITKVINIF